MKPPGAIPCHTKAEQRRRAVCCALRRALGADDPRIPDLFALWEGQFAMLPNLIVARYVAICEMQVGLSDSERMGLLRALLVEMGRRCEDLPAYPLHWVDSADAGTIAFLNGDAQ